MYQVLTEQSFGSMSCVPAKRQVLQQHAPVCTHVMQAHYTLLELPLQDCLVYLCGTKYDLVQEDKKARKVEASTVDRYGDGKCFNLLA